MRRTQALAAVAAGLIAILPAVSRAVNPVASFEEISTSTQKLGYTADGNSRSAAMDLSGRFVAFYSDAKDLAKNSVTGRWDQYTYRDVFVRDRVTGVTEHVSVSFDGTEAMGNSPATLAPPVISYDGCLVAFSSNAARITENDPDGTGEDVFLRDRCAQPPRTRFVGAGTNPAISGDGRFLAYLANGAVVLWDRFACGDDEICDGWVVSDSVGQDGAAVSPAISGDGNIVAFAFQSPGKRQQIYVRDLGPAGDLTELVSVNTQGQPGNGHSYQPALNADGSVVAFKSDSSDLVSSPRDVNGYADTFVRDRRTGSTAIVSLDRCGLPSRGLSAHPGISGDGRFVAFPAFDDLLDATDTDRNGQSDIYLHDRDADQNGISDEPPPLTCPADLTTNTVRVSVELPDEKSMAGVGEEPPAVSANGKWIAFSSSSDVLVLDDENMQSDVFVACNPLKPPCPPQCLGSEQCPEGYSCLPDDNSCVTQTPTNTPPPTFTPTPEETPCSVDADCPPGQVCVDGRCVPATPKPKGKGGGGCSCDIDPRARTGAVPTGLALAAPAVLLWLRRRMTTSCRGDVR